jgi:hypothetical protein
VSLPESKLPDDETATATPLQRVLIAGATLIVVALTVVAAILLAVRNPAETTPTPIVTPTLAAVQPTLTFTPPPPRPTDTSTPSPTSAPATPTFTPAPIEEPTQTPVPPLATDTPLPEPPTPTFTPVVVIVTPTPSTDSVPPPADTPSACPPPANWAAYTVQSGDTLNTLSGRTGVSVFELQQANCLVNLTLQPGQVVFLPFNPPTSTPRPTGTPVTPSPTPTRTSTPMRPPEIFSATVSQDKQTITVVGRYFEADDPTFSVAFVGSSLPQDRVILAKDLRLKSNTGVVVLVPPDLPAGVYSFYVINPDEQFDFEKDLLTLP